MMLKSADAENCFPAAHWVAHRRMSAHRHSERQRGRQTEKERQRSSWIMKTRKMQASYKIMDTQPNNDIFLEESPVGFCGSHSYKTIFSMKGNIRRETEEKQDQLRRVHQPQKSASIITGSTRSKSLKGNSWRKSLNHQCWCRPIFRNINVYYCSKFCFYLIQCNYELAVKWTQSLTWPNERAK